VISTPRRVRSVYSAEMAATCVRSRASDLFGSGSPQCALYRPTLSAGSWTGEKMKFVRRETVAGRGVKAQSRGYAPPCKKNKNDKTSFVRRQLRLITNYDSVCRAYTSATPRGETGLAEIQRADLALFNAKR